MSGESCYSSMDNGTDCAENMIHHCQLPADHSDDEFDGYHQCECGETW